MNTATEISSPIVGREFVMPVPRVLCVAEQLRFDFQSSCPLDDLMNESNKTTSGQSQDASGVLQAASEASSPSHSVVQVFDKAMCCSTGVCGPQVDPVLPKFAADLEWLKSQGHRVTRWNLSQDPAAYGNQAETDVRFAGIGRLLWRRVGLNEADLGK